MKERGNHLTEEQILISLVDDNDLAEDARSHLLACPLCKDKKTAIMSELERLGEMAKKFAPSPRKKITLPLRPSRRIGLRLPAFAAGLAMVLLIVILWGPSFLTDSSKQRRAQFPFESNSGLHLVEDILGESALSNSYSDIAVSSYSYFDEEFLEFVVPLRNQGDSV